MTNLATEAAVQVLDTSYDSGGVSITTATRIAGAPRQGTIYNPLDLAAAFPVWFHPMSDGRYMGLFSERWTAATVGSGGPQSYSSHTVSLAPSWVLFDPATGSRGAVTALRARLSGVRYLIGAASMGSYLFTLGTLGGASHVQHHRIGQSGEVILQGEEVVADQGDVSFTQGCWVDNRYLFLVGTDSAGRVFLARKRWSRIGTSLDPNGQWEFKGVRGWDTAPDGLEPLADRAGGALVTSAPVSHARRHDRDYLSVVTATGVKIYSSRQVESSWGQERVIDAVNLRMQPQLHHNPAMLPEGKRSGIPFLTMDRVNTVNAKQLLVRWGVFAPV